MKKGVKYKICPRCKGLKIEHGCIGEGLCGLCLGEGRILIKKKDK